ncbi:MAG: hypothetical protein V3S55_09975 [Nitrospiraceae bacterium]
MNATVYVANLLPIDAARIGQTIGLSGTTHDALGFGAWGVEPTTIVNFSDIGQMSLASFVQEIFRECPKEDALYIVTDGVGALVHRTHKGSNIPCML